MENNLDHAQCPAIETIAMIGGRWKVIILQVLSKHARRFGEINVRVPSISRKVLTEQLRELEADGLISRKQFEEFPPRVEYALTEYGESLCPLLAYIAAWNKEKV
ncbi:MAG: helix-turn-helix domain-containing protein [Dyadobacter sp.]|jgi:DNA-binding HxlR family transcriptional regulator